MNYNKPYKVYEKDLKFNKKESINPINVEWDYDELEKKYYKTNFDSIEYRLYECKKNNFTFLDLSYMDLKSIPTISTEIKQKVKYLFINNNNFSTISLSSLEFPILESIDMSYNKIQKIIELPMSLIEISCSNNNLKEILSTNLNKLEHLDCSINNISNIPYYEKLKSLICNKNNISKIELKDYQNLVYLKCCDNPITSLPYDKLINLCDLICNNTKISTIGSLSSIKYIEVLDTYIDYIDYSKTLEDLYFNVNGIKNIDKRFKILSYDETKTNPKYGHIIFTI